MPLPIPLIDLVPFGQPARPGQWWSSSGNAGQSTINAWSPDMVRPRPGGGVDLALGAAPAGSARPAVGGEIRSADTASTGTFSWLAEAPDEMAPGAVFGLFAYRADWAAAPWIEFDLEWTNGDTRNVNIGVHMTDPQGRHVTNVTPTVVDLGFDAADGLHSYDIVVTGTGAVFRADGVVLAYLGAADMPGGAWGTTALRSYADLWAADSRMAEWTGNWATPAVPMVATVAGGAVRAGDLSGPMPLLGGAGADTLWGGAGRDVLDGLGGDDRLGGGAGQDRIQGGVGRDMLFIDAGDDWMDGGAGTADWARATGATGVRVDLTTWGRQDTGLGRDEFRGIENLMGGDGADRFWGNAGVNNIYGMAGDDAIDARQGRDVIDGGAGRDDLRGGWQDRARDVFILARASDSAPGARRDVIGDFEAGIDVVDLRAVDADPTRAGDQAFTRSSGAAAYSVWTVWEWWPTIVRGDTTGDGVADFEIQIDGVRTLGANDLLL